MGKYDGSRHHLWKKVGSDMWQCYWCKGFRRDKFEPDREAIAKLNPSDQDKSSAKAKAKE